RRPPLKKTTPGSQGARQTAWLEPLRMQARNRLPNMTFGAALEREIGVAHNEMAKVLPIRRQGVIGVAAMAPQVRKPLLHGGGQGMHGGPSGVGVWLGGALQALQAGAGQPIDGVK